MAGGPGNRVRQRMDVVGLAWLLSPWLLGLGMTSWLRRKKWR